MQVLLEKIRMSRTSPRNVKDYSLKLYSIELCSLSSVVLDDKTISTLKKLRMNADDFEVRCTIGRGHFGEVK